MRFMTKLFPQSCLDSCLSTHHKICHFFAHCHFTLSCYLFALKGKIHTLHYTVILKFYFKVPSIVKCTVYTREHRGLDSRLCLGNPDPSSESASAARARPRSEDPGRWGREPWLRPLSWGGGESDTGHSLLTDKLSDWHHTLNNYLPKIDCDFI